MGLNRDTRVNSHSRGNAKGGESMWQSERQPANDRMKYMSE